MTVRPFLPKNRRASWLFALVVCCFALSIFIKGRSQSPESNKASLVIQANQFDDHPTVTVLLLSSTIVDAPLLRSVLLRMSPMGCKWHRRS